MMLSTEANGVSINNNTRHVEHKSVSTCTFLKTTINASELFGTSSVVAEEENVEAIAMEPGSILRMLPMERHYGGWSTEDHFDPVLLCPFYNQGCIVLTFEAMARECIAIALSPSPEFVYGKTYEVHIGANGNLSTVIRRVKKGGGDDEVEDVFPSIRICSEKEYTKYWVVFQRGKLSVGIRTTSDTTTTTTSVVGNHCLGTLDDTMYDTLRPGQDAVRYVGLGNSSFIGRRGDNNNNIVKIRNLILLPIPPSIKQSGGIVMEKIGQILIQKLMMNNKTEQDELLLLHEYEEECQKAQARATKFNVAYKDPPPDAFLKWSEARRLRANPQSGFATGFDLTTKEEEEKRLARKERFSITPKRKMTTASDDDENNVINNTTTNDDEIKQQQETKKDDQDTTQQQQQLHLLPVIQAWDNQELVREFRVDPQVVVGMNDNGNETQTVPEKIHIFAIDWAAFKQIRSDDIMSYFSLYGPSYVEWLGELSCNVLFQDRFSAARALAASSQQIPSPPPVVTQEEEGKKRYSRFG